MDAAAPPFQCARRAASQRIRSRTRQTMMQQLPVQVQEKASMCATFEGSSIMPAVRRCDET